MVDWWNQCGGSFAEARRSSFVGTMRRHTTSHKSLVASPCLSYYGRLAVAFNEILERLIKHARSDSALLRIIIFRTRR
jgi:hypothetical protein